jgi:hypothetical protein
VDGWYLFTSPKHYCTHNCHIRHTKSERISDTIQFQHKRITNPTITHTNKVMHALADCVKALQGMTGSARNSQAAQDLQGIIDATQANIQARPERFKDNATPSANPHTQRVPRVQPPPSVPTPHIDVNRRITRSMLMQTPVPRVPSNGAPTKKPTHMPTDSTKRERLRKRQAIRLQNSATPISTSPHIQIRTQVATEAAQVAPPSMSTRSRAQQSSKPLPPHQPGFTAAAMRQQQHQRDMVRLTQRITQLENEVHHAMAVMDANTDKLLNYRQLMRNAKHRQAWSLSSANKFGRSANGIGGRIKNPTNTIEFICQHEVPTDA